MAELIDFRHGAYSEIAGLIASKTHNEEDIYFASDKPLFWAKGQWYGVASLTSSVDSSTGEITLTINADNGTKIEHTISGAGMTTEQKEQLAKAYNFVNSITAEDTDNVINKWQEIVDFLADIESGTLDSLLDSISQQITDESNARKGITITAGNGLTGGGTLEANRTITLGTPSTITDSSTNTVSADSHTHAIDEASTSKRGIVQLNDSLTSDSTVQALTAKQGKQLKSLIDTETTNRTNTDNKHTADIKSIADLVNLLFTPHYSDDGSLESIQANAGFWSEDYISAKGKDGEASGGAGIDLSAVWDTLANNTDSFANTVINIAHIPDITTDKITDFATAVKALLTSENMPTITVSKISDFATAVANAFNTNISTWSAGRKVNAGNGLTGGGALNADVTLSLATSGVTAGTYPKVAVDSYGRVTKGSTLAETDIPTLSMGKVSGLSALKTQSDTNKSNIEKNTSDIATINGTLVNFGTTVSNHNNRITRVESALKWKSLTD